MNTHKGIIFSLAVLGGAYGRASALSGGDGPALADVLSFCRALGSCALAELPSLPVSTNGERCYRAYGSDGVRGEAARGFPSVMALGLPSLRRALADGRSINDAALALLALIGGVEDTNMIHRGGYEAAQARREEARAFRRRRADRHARRPRPTVYRRELKPRRLRGPSGAEPAAAFSRPA